MRPIQCSCILAASTVAALTLSGCGGSSGPGTPPSGGGGGLPQQGNFGGMAVSYNSAKPLQAATVSQKPLVFTGVGGANFTNIAFNPIPLPNLTQTAIAYNDTGEVSAYSLLTKAFAPVTNMSPLLNTCPSYSHDGHIVFDGVYNGNGTMMTMMADGSGITPVAGPGTQVYPAFSPLNNMIAYVSGQQLKIANTSGTVLATAHTATFGGIQQLLINQSATGNFSLSFGGQTTPLIAWPLTTGHEIVDALNALPSIKGAGASVIVTTTASGQDDVFTIVFQGAYLNRNASRISIVNSTINGPNFMAILPSLILQPFRPAWNPNGTQIAATAQVGGMYPCPYNTQGAAIFQTDGTLVSYIPLGAAGSSAPSSQIGGLAYSPDGSKLAFAQSGNSTQSIYGIDLTNLQQWFIHNAFTATVAGADSDPTFAPDGKTVAFARATTPSSIWTAQVNGSNAVALVTPVSNVLGFPDWQPFPAKQTFIGSGGTMGTSASGFIFGQNATGFASLVVFNAVTPSTVTVTPQGLLGLAFLVKADSLTSLQYTNTYYGAKVSVIPTQSATTPQMLLMFNIITGTVTGTAAVTPKAPVSSSKQGSAIVYTGRFDKVWDASGKLIASSATRIETDSAKQVLRAR